MKTEGFPLQDCHTYPYVSMNPQCREVLQISCTLQFCFPELPSRVVISSDGTSDQIVHTHLLSLSNPAKTPEAPVLSQQQVDPLQLPAELTSLQVDAGFFRLARYNAKEWYFFILGSAGSAVLGLVTISPSETYLLMPNFFFDLTGPLQVCRNSLRLLYRVVRQS